MPTAPCVPHSVPFATTILPMVCITTTSPPPRVSCKNLEDGNQVLSKEENSRLAGRLDKYIANLEAALVRIENKTYGVDRITGKLIPKERLRIVPHATLDVESKLNEKKK